MTDGIDALERLRDGVGIADVEPTAVLGHHRPGPVGSVEQGVDRDNVMSIGA